jgi:cytochrome c-type biogenesis protein CcmE
MGDGRGNSPGARCHPGAGAQLLDSLATMRSPGSRTVRVIIASAVVLIAAGVLIWVGVGRGSVYYYSVSELKTVTSAQNVRVSGELNGGTLVRENGTHITFVMRDRDRPADTLSVVYDGALPDSFKDADGSEVVVEGRRLASGVFEAASFIAKCPSKYEAAT